MSQFESSRGNRGNGGGDHSSGSRIAIKFLLGNGITGSLIGTKGSAVKCLIDMSGAKVYVSNGDTHFPGSTDRIILVSGSLSQITVVQSLIWHLIANNVRSSEMGERSETWDPYTALDECNEGIHDEIMVTCKLSIPQAAAGMILGRNGSSIRSITEESGARICMASKDDGIITITHERVLTITGPKINCVKCTSLVVAKLSEDMAIAQYAYRGTSYVGTPSGLSSPSALGSPSYGGSTLSHNNRDHDNRSNANVSPYGRGLSSLSSHGLDGTDDRNYRGGMRSDNALPPPRRNASGSSLHYPHQASLSPSSYSINNNSNNNSMYLGAVGQTGSGNSIPSGGAFDVSSSSMPLIDALTTISLAVPETLVGNILGRNGNAVREISSLSGAKVLVSPRGEYIEGTTNRLVTIQGSPECAQTAHHFIVQKLQQGALLNTSSGTDRLRGGSGGSLGVRGVGRERSLGFDSMTSTDQSRMYPSGGGGGRGRNGGDDDNRYPRHRETIRRGGNRGVRGERAGSGRGYANQEEHQQIHHHDDDPDNGNMGKMEHEEDDEGQEQEEEEEGVDQEEEEDDDDVYQEEEEGVYDEVDDDGDGGDDDRDDGIISNSSEAMQSNDPVPTISASEENNGTDKEESQGHHSQDSNHENDNHENVNHEHVNHENDESGDNQIHQQQDNNPPVNNTNDDGVVESR